MIEIQVNGRSHQVANRPVTHEAVVALACWEGAKAEVLWRPYAGGDEVKATELKPGASVPPAEGLVFYVRR